MFKQELIKIWEKVKRGEALKAYDNFVLWANDFGFFGIGFGIAAAYFWAARLFGGAESTFLGISNWTYVCVFTTLLAVKSWSGIEKIWKRKWNKLFPEGLVIPYINKKIK